MPTQNTNRKLQSYFGEFKNKNRVGFENGHGLIF
jgi:hypothetical protein